MTRGLHAITTKVFITAAFLSCAGGVGLHLPVSSRRAVTLAARSVAAAHSAPRAFTAAFTHNTCQAPRLFRAAPTSTIGLSSSKRGLKSSAMSDEFPITKTEEEWKEQLTAKEYQVLREKGTEGAGTGEYDKFKPTEGHFACKACSAPLYSAEAKFNR
jgi:hypothetical protein